MPDSTAGASERMYQTHARPALSKRAPSLFAQMAIGSIIVAMVAVALVAVITLFAFSVAFRRYQMDQMQGEAARSAITIGQGKYFSEVNGPAQLRTLVRKRLGTTNIWVMDTYGKLIVEPTSVPLQADQLAQDKDMVTPALLKALEGQSTSGSLNDTILSPFAQRVYAVEPIYANGATQGEVVGAVALSSPPRVGAAAFVVFQTAITRILFISALGAVAFAIVVAILLSRRLIRPLARLTTAAARMANGDYAVRVDVGSPDEYRRLAATFNEMAAALEHDVNELQRQEQLRRDLVANVSHELATPLTAISGFTEALLDGMLHSREEREDTVRRIARESARLRRLVDQLRQVARYEAGTQSLERAPLQLRTLVEETLAVLAPELSRHSVEAFNYLPPTLPLVYADGDRMTEVLLNLMDNALRHVPAGGRIEVAARVEGDFVRVGVADSGPGISPQDRQRIFDRFYRVDRSRNSSTGGSGLGLAIVRALVEAHGGTIRVEDAQGGGALFSFTLPMYATQSAAPERRMTAAQGR
jgi:two-component system sensor histidine kinase BaeS